MISKQEILKFVRHVHKRGKGIPDRRSMHPRREWLFGFSIFLIVTGAGAVMSMISFENYKNIDKRTFTADLALPVYNEARAKTVLEDFGERKQKYTQLVDQINVIEVPVIVETGTTSSSTINMEEVMATSTLGEIIE